MDLVMEAEKKAWIWSPLYADFILVPTPPCLARPFLHTEDEFQKLVAWFKEEGVRIGEKNSPPHMARALKLYARGEIGAKMPMLCPVRGLTEDTMLDRPDQIMFAMEELIRVGKIYFPTMDISGDDFEDFRMVLDEGDNRGGQVGLFVHWRRNTFIRACLDMVNLDQLDVLRDMWVAKEGGVDTEAVTRAFRSILLLRENMDLEYCFGSLECTGIGARGGEEFFQASKKLLVESQYSCKAKITAWNLNDDLEDLDDFRASQVLCRFEAAHYTGEGHGRVNTGDTVVEQGGPGWQGATETEEGGHWGQVEDTEPRVELFAPIVVFKGNA
ncbi:hypothetical protein KC19_VG164600 [Ceratodon purpureus]|uniref:Uncharacterized protein n=1 Tax=Ceratodon purpureus TaxID=3225 RepID=A0A8T0HQN0_CERPU|nr:hypothetical protein KC19_VG164600 [Ceratodon purpureus]